MLSLDKNHNYGKHYVILPMIVRELGIQTMVEIGVHSGLLTKAILGGCPGITKYFMVDPWTLSKCASDYRHAIFQRAVRIQRTYRKQVQMLVDTSADAVDQFEDGSLDFVFIDGNHMHDYVLQDITIWWPKIRSGGYMGGHDLDNKHGHGVRSAIEVAPVLNGLTIHHGTPPINWHGVWMVHKP